MGMGMKSLKWEGIGMKNLFPHTSTLDVSKAFDKLNQYALFIKLMDRNVPLVILNVLVYWCAMCSVVVRWDSMFSSMVQLQCGLGRVEYCHLFYLHSMLMI